MSMGYHNDCMGDSGWETANVHSWLQWLTVDVHVRGYYRDVAGDLAPIHS